MKMLGYAKFDLKDWDSDFKKDAALHEERKKFPDRYPKQLCPDYFLETGKVFTLYEGTHEQFANLAAWWIPELNWQFVAIFEASDLQKALKRVK
jgi:hypothetical protein